MVLFMMMLPLLYFCQKKVRGILILNNHAISQKMFNRAVELIADRRVFPAQLFVGHREYQGDDTGSKPAACGCGKDAEGLKPFFIREIMGTVHRKRTIDACVLLQDNFLDACESFL